VERGFARGDVLELGTRNIDEFAPLGRVIYRRPLSRDAQTSSLIASSDLLRQFCRAVPIRIQG
jgi:hypothetical protein